MASHYLRVRQKAGAQNELRRSEAGMRLSEDKPTPIYAARTGNHVQQDHPGGRAPMHGAAGLAWDGPRRRYAHGEARLGARGTARRKRHGYAQDARAMQARTLRTGACSHVADARSGQTHEQGDHASMVLVVGQYDA